MSKIIGIDYGEKRVGLAVADDILRTAYPLTTLQNDNTIISQIVEKVKTAGGRAVVFGYPRNNSGETTEQTKIVENFVENLRPNLAEIGVKIYFQDESLTSVVAQKQLEELGKPFLQDEIDARAAAIILQDFLGSVEGKNA